MLENTIELSSKEDLAANSKAMGIFEVYDRASGIIERTHIAMGKKRKFVIANSSTGSDKIIANASPSTH